MNSQFRWICWLVWIAVAAPVGLVAQDQGLDRAEDNVPFPEQDAPFPADEEVPVDEDLEFNSEAPTDEDRLRRRSPRVGERRRAPERGRRRAPRSEMAGPITAEMEKAAWEFVGRVSPDHLPELKRMKAEHPRDYEGHIRELLRERKHLEMLKRENPEEFTRHMKQRELERKSHQLAERYRHQNKEEWSRGEQEKARAHIRVVLGQLFDLREADRLRQIRRLESELEKLHVLTKKRQENKEQIITLRLQELLGEDSHLRW